MNFWRYWIILSGRAQLTVCSFQPRQFQELKKGLCQPVSVLVAMSCLFGELVDFADRAFFI